MEIFEETPQNKITIVDAEQYEETKRLSKMTRVEIQAAAEQLYKDWLKTNPCIDIKVTNLDSIRLPMRLVWDKESHWNEECPIQQDVMMDVSAQVCTAINAQFQEALDTHRNKCLAHFDRLEKISKRRLRIWKAVTTASVVITLISLFV